MAVYATKSNQMDRDSDYRLRGIGHAQEGRLGIQKNQRAVDLYPGYQRRI